ncbi:hypothetical protein Ngar_c10930 [Candidatus Nitrososphaera gargensis Ga9.2]|uniref:Uncharacterized protein n=1 Tax=Nitrososphaera gargensis (strain Ga9.2) TaxID=1237085 RepID=K0IE36_NITGG|nr:hypothetical protein [Candidatus Nitrososphaera gargensis]AFU58035.1 hypothetical protein Ngar_c10930 [Candidatus Nitrososphaera gargensis Ga9.2]
MKKWSEFYSGKILEYDAGATRLVQLRLFGSNLKPNEPIPYFKPVNPTVKIYFTVHILLKRM